MSSMYTMDIFNAIKKVVADAPQEVTGRPILATVEQWQEKSHDLDVLLTSWDFDAIDWPSDMDDLKEHINNLRQKWLKWKK